MCAGGFKISLVKKLKELNTERTIIQKDLAIFAQMAE